MSHVPTPSQTVGPFFSIGLRELCRENIECDVEGRRVTIRGRILDGDGEPVPDAVLEIWQPEDAELRETKNGPVEHRSGKIPVGFGRIATDDSGEFRFSTKKPGSRRDAEGFLHAPHLVVLVLMRGLLRHLVTRIYFPDVAENSEDRVLNLVPSDRRATLIATRVAASTSGENELRWDIHLQGERETVFFET
ncbi:MAG TPA: protocatechuate 3,4-dioxygenase subunit alpha [Candidatus Acidoferrum sp.]|jgi:protocatechuate 3,4-dioxygenase alpha subunit